VCDSRGATIASDTVTIGIEESRRVAFRIEREPLSVAGRVVDVDGRPIPGARLHIERHLFCIAQADADGRFALDDLFDADAELKISAEGFADVRLRAADAADQRVFVLEPARTMWVEVRSMSEATDAPGLRLELQGGGQLDGNRVELGLYRFDGVPRRVGWLRCERSGDGMRVAPDETRVRFVVDP
jgi:hypothetical protein